MLVKPAPGRRVRDPATKRIVSEEDGLEVDPTLATWSRLLRDGDLVEAPAQAAAAPAPAPAPPAPPAPPSAPKAAPDRDAQEGKA